MTIDVCPTDGSAVEVKVVGKSCCDPVAFDVRWCNMLEVSVDVSVLPECCGSPLMRLPGSEPDVAE